MKLNTIDVQLEGCRCRLKDDPAALQQRLVQRIQELFDNDKKLNRKYCGAASISGKFLEIDEGNFALHFMCAFLGKPRIGCAIQVAVDDRVLWSDRVEASSSGTCFHSMGALLRADVDLLARDILKRTLKALKNTAAIQDLTAATTACT